MTDQLTIVKKWSKNTWWNFIHTGWTDQWLWSYKPIVPWLEKSTSRVQDEKEEAETGVKERLKMDKIRHKCSVAQHDV